MRWGLALSLIGMLVFSLSGCATYNISTSEYRLGSQTMRYLETRAGTVVDVREVTARPMGTQGTGAGAVLGGLAGHAISGSTTGIVAGAILGGVAGHFAEQAMATQQAMEVTVEIDRTGEMVTVVQGTDFVPMRGQRVKVVRQNNELRVRPLSG